MGTRFKIVRALRTALGIAGAVVLAVSLVACALHISNSGQVQVPTQPAGTLRVATYNVHYIRLRDEEGS